MIRCSTVVGEKWFCRLMLQYNIKQKDKPKKFNILIDKQKVIMTKMNRLINKWWHPFLNIPPLLPDQKSLYPTMISVSIPSQDSLPTV